MEKDDYKHTIWAIVILLTVILIAVTINNLSKQPILIKFEMEMENNTRNLVEKVYDCTENTTVLSKINITNEATT